MLRIERYLFRTLTSAFVASLVTLTAILWVIQALKSLDLVTQKGQTILVFLFMTGLGLPFFVANVAPVALFASVLYCLNRLNGDSELVVMTASGVSPGRVLRPFLAMFALVFAGMAALYLIIVPWGFDTITSMAIRQHGNFLANFARPGPFIELETGFVFHYRERGPDGSLRGVFIQDARNPNDVATFIAERGDIVDKGDDSYLLLEKGSTQRPRGEGDSTIITFEDYAIDLAQFVHKEDYLKAPRERDTWSLLTNDPTKTSPRVIGQIRGEIYDRFSSPLYAFAAGLLAFAALGEARTTRQGRGWAIAGAILLFVLLKVFGIADAILLRSRPETPPLWITGLAWAIPLGTAAICLDFIFRGPMRAFAPATWRRLRKPSRGR